MGEGWLSGQKKGALRGAVKAISAFKCVGGGGVGTVRCRGRYSGCVTRRFQDRVPAGVKPVVPLKKVLNGNGSSKYPVVKKDNVFNISYVSHPGYGLPPSKSINRVA